MTPFSSLTWSHAEAPLSEVLVNPERGFYYHTESDSSNPTPLDLATLQGVRQGGRTVLLRVYYLDTFFDTDDLSTELLNQLEEDFQTMLNAGMKCVLRFAYYRPSIWPDPSCCGVSGLPVSTETCCITEPPLARILAHIASLATVLQSWTHAIVAVQSGFIGPWGEGHSSTNFQCSAANAGKRQIIAALLDAVPARQVQIRYPSLKQALFFPEEEPNMAVIASNLVLNGDFETVDGGATGAANWWPGVGSGYQGELTSVDSIAGKSIKVNAGFSAAQYLSLTEVQGASSNIVKIYGHSKLYNGEKMLIAILLCVAPFYEQYFNRNDVRCIFSYDCITSKYP